MGCIGSNDSIESIPQIAIAEPKGPACDLLVADGDIIENITKDPHINFYQKKI